MKFVAAVQLCEDEKRIDNFRWNRPKVGIFDLPTHDRRVIKMVTVGEDLKHNLVCETQ